MGIVRHVFAELRAGASLLALGSASVGTSASDATLDLFPSILAGVGQTWMSKRPFEWKAKFSGSGPLYDLAQKLCEKVAALEEALLLVQEERDALRVENVILSNALSLQALRQHRVGEALQEQLETL